MKKIVLFCFCVILSLYSLGQNLFPVNGNVGIGTTSPLYPIHQYTNQNGGYYISSENASTGNLAASGFNAINNLGQSAAFTMYGSNHAPYGSLTAGDASLYTTESITLMADNALGVIKFAAGGNAERMRIHTNGNVGIGTTNVNDVNYKLFVETGIRTRKVKVDMDTWSDYVFASSYKLLSLKELEQFIKQHRHLPDVPSEEEVKKEGVDLGENQAVLLKIIEELTLYILEQDKKNEDQQTKLNEQVKYNQQLEERLTRLETALVKAKR